MDAWRYLKCRFLIRQTRLHVNSSSHATWQNLGDLSLIKGMQLNRNDLHPSISSELLIEDEESNSTATSNFA